MKRRSEIRLKSSGGVGGVRDELIRRINLTYFERDMNAHLIEVVDETLRVLRERSLLKEDSSG